MTFLELLNRYRDAWQAECRAREWGHDPTLPVQARIKLELAAQSVATVLEQEHPETAREAIAEAELFFGPLEESESIR